MAPAQTPYSPPVAPVSDPAEPEVPKPAAISRAAMCLWISAAVVVVSSALTLSSISAAGVDKGPLIAIAAFSFGLLALVAWLLNAGHGWVRWLFLAVFVLGSGMFALGLILTPAAYIALPLKDQVSALVQLGLQTTALVFMFTPAAGQWLRSRKGK